MRSRRVSVLVSFTSGREGAGCTAIADFSGIVGDSFSLCRHSRGLARPRCDSPVRYRRPDTPTYHAAAQQDVTAVTTLRESLKNLKGLPRKVSFRCPAPLASQLRSPPRIA